MGGIDVRRRGAVSTRAAVSTRVIVLGAGHLGVAAALTLLAQGGPGTTAGLDRIAALALAFAVVGLLPVHVELGRHATSVTLVDAVLVVGLFIVHDAPAVTLAALVGEVVACGLQRQRPIKIFYNAAATAGTVTLAARTFALLDTPDATEPLTWLVTLAAVLVYAISNHASTSTVLMVVEGRRFHDLFLDALVPAAAATGVSAGLGLTVVVLFAAAPAAPVLLLPLGAVAYLAFRAVASHRSELLRFTRLYEASSKTGSLGGVTSTLATLADEARSLVGGTVAVADAPGVSGAWSGVLIGEGFGGPVSAETVADVRRLATGTIVELPTTSLPAAVSRLAPAAKDAVVAGATGDAEVALVVFRDITDDRGATRADVLGAFAAHAALAASNARLFEEVERSLQDQIDLHRHKDEFLAAVSHELRTPLTGVLGAVSTMRRFGDQLDAQKLERLTELAERQGLRLKRLIEDLLLLAAAESGAASVRTEPVEVEPFLRRAAAAGTLDPTSIAVEVVLEAGTPRAIHTDPARVGRIVDALLDNAQKFAGGRVELIASPAAGGGLAIAVRDHGPGVPAPDRERIFERFVQLDQSSTRNHGGTGTGLYLSRRLAELVGGVLVAGETAGGGSTFMLALPDQPERAIAQNQDSPDHESGRVVALTAATRTEDQP